MERDFVLDFVQLKEYCEVHPELLKINGKCGECIQEKRCMLENREMQIDSVLHMDEKESRYRAILKYAKKTNGAILHAVPSKIYKMLYGTYHDTLPCPFDASCIFENLDKIKAVYELLSDSYSKLCYLNVIMFRLTLDNEYAIRALSMEPQYFIKPFQSLSSEAVFVDCGAYTGDSYDNYCRYNNIPRMAYLFEPDKKNIEKMSESLTKDNVSIVEKGVYSTTAKMFFIGGIGLSSYLSKEDKENGSIVEVTSIDDHIPENVDFIKMDIEGAEMEALIGAEKHIRDNYPKLGKC